MLKALCNWKAETTLVPFSGIQFLDFGFAIEAAGKSMRFIERTEAGSDGSVIRVLHPLSGDDEADRPVVDARKADDVDYDISVKKALEPFLDKWAPVPVLRIKPGRAIDGREMLDAGPSTWARVYVSELPERDPDTGASHRVVLALDTQCLAAVEGQPYLAPSLKDAEDEREFRLATRVADMDWFLRQEVGGTEGAKYDVQKWVDEWLDELFREFKVAVKVASGRRNLELKSEDFPYAFEHWARYLTMLRILETALAMPKIRLLDTVSEDKRYEPVKVDLVLDIGNSRTCGILVESYPNESRVDLNDSYVLELRDLSQPTDVYRRPFPSRVEFAQAAFGKDHVARRSGRTRAFLWPSLVRVGDEAMRLIETDEGTETTSGMSSPKRYVWDDQPVNQDWRFQNVESRQTLPMIARSAFRFVNERGDVIRQVGDDEEKKLIRRGVIAKDSAIRAKFSRSSLYGFMLAEIVFQAMVLINDPAVRASRKQSELPRKLQRVILTLPSATPIQEQCIMRSRAEGAIKLLWDVLDWTREPPPGVSEPRVLIDWDEASCTQLVYLYTEITQKLSGQIDGFFDLMGKPRPFVDVGERAPAKGAAPERSLRLACIDIGGGTTDLMITTYHALENRAIKPTQTFREGFRIAGDDVVKELIEGMVLPQLEEAIANAGSAHPRELIKELFGGDQGDGDEQERQRRRQFALRVLTPLAVAVLGAAESLDETEKRQLALGDILGWRQAQPGDDEARTLHLPAHLIDYLEQPVHRRGGTAFRLADVTFSVDPLQVAAIVRDTLGTVLQHLAEVINHLDCDVVLLAGRPSRLPAVRDLVLELLPVTPDRIVSMHAYLVGTWYPFRDLLTNRIGDPKTTAAVGGMLCSLVETQIPNFKLFTSRLQMRSTARYIGEMDSNGRIEASRVMVADADLDKRARQAPAEASLRMYTTIHIGYRQLPLERWTATPIYRLSFANASIGQLAMPLTVTLVRDEIDDEDLDFEGRRRAEALREAFRIDAVVAADGTDARPKDVRLQFHTLGFEDTYWLDSGSFVIV